MGAKYVSGNGTYDKNKYDDTEYRQRGIKNIDPSELYEVDPNQKPYYESVSKRANRPKDEKRFRVIGNELLYDGTKAYKIKNDATNETKIIPAKDIFKYMQDGESIVMVMPVNANGQMELDVGNAQPVGGKGGEISPQVQAEIRADSILRQMAEVFNEVLDDERVIECGYEVENDRSTSSYMMLLTDNHQPVPFVLNMVVNDQQVFTLTTPLNQYKVTGNINYIWKVLHKDLKLILRKLSVHLVRTSDINLVKLKNADKDAQKVNKKLFRDGYLDIAGNNIIMYRLPMRNTKISSVPDYVNLISSNINDHVNDGLDGQEVDEIICHNKYVYIWLFGDLVDKNMKDEITLVQAWKMEDPNELHEWAMQIEYLEKGGSEELDKARDTWMLDIESQQDIPYTVVDTDKSNMSPV